MTQKTDDLTKIDLPKFDTTDENAPFASLATEKNNKRIQNGLLRFAKYMAKKQEEEKLKAIQLPRLEKESDIFNIATTITDEQAQAFLNELDKMPKVKKEEFAETLTKLVLPMMDIKDDLSKVDLSKMDIADKDAPFASVVRSLDPNDPEAQKNVLAAAKQIAVGFVALSTIIINKEVAQKSGAFISLAKNKQTR